MKKILGNISCLLILFLGVTGCEDQLDINRNPDSLSQGGVALATEFPAAVTGVIGATGSYAAIVGGFWSQYWTQSPSSNQYKEIDDYSILSNSGVINGFWQNMYDALGDTRNVKRIALEQENWNYYLMATVLEAYNAQIMVDFFDQVPFMEATNPEILQPQFDSGEEVYDQIITNLNEALEKDLNESQGEAPGADDLIFGGNMDNWVAFANTLKLKIYLRQENARPDVTAAGITNLLNSGAEFLNVDAGMDQFEDAPNKSNPLYESNIRQLNTPTNLRASTTLYSFLETNEDPRLEEYYTNGISLDQGDFNNTDVEPNSIAVVELDPQTPAYLISREESLFMQAEAQLKYGSEALAQELYNEGVIENFSKYGLDGAAFVAPGGAYAFPTMEMKKIN
ncbi:SusD/RagB family nutrient-binding outer membrane lipoprotein [Antarcticibacterium sp. 1MA-6-2]|uniref:SusD/RagB family nutrient-binding outer membrane lipoprotein n=1 Tax=Antarcticibacterium sp. 1MA-6-2 TaxID=2908210 RepID=UPI0021023729|nr:SusD/RagB family nutrient-binding outer membrane lipoprotein [Antarcticibacterium sp. 1MA-6-2]